MRCVVLSGLGGGRPVGRVADQEPGFLNLRKLRGDGLEAPQKQITHREMTPHSMIQQWPDCIGEVRLSVVNDVVHSFRRSVPQNANRLKVRNASHQERSQSNQAGHGFSGGARSPPAPARVRELLALLVQRQFN